MLDMGPTFYKIGRIGRGFLAVMAKPVAGEWVDDEFSGLREGGLRQVVSLLEDHEAFELGLEDEQGHCERHDLRFVSYPIPDRGLPPSVRGFRDLTRSIHRETAAGRSTVVHCRAGIGRTGLVAASVLLHGGFGVDEALNRVSERRGITVPDTDEQSAWLFSNHAQIVGRESDI